VYNKEEKDMATISFDKKMILNSDHAAENLIRQLESPQVSSSIKTMDISEKIRRGNSLLTKKYSR
jgi:hypothetical protein